MKILVSEKKSLRNLAYFKEVLRNVTHFLEENVIIY